MDRKGGGWPPPPQGMICFAEYFLEADSDQVLFDVSGGLVGGEYPVMYYSHETRPPGVRKIADGFTEWLNHHFVDDMEAPLEPAATRPSPSLPAAKTLGVANDGGTSGG